MLPSRTPRIGGFSAWGLSFSAGTLLLEGVTRKAAWGAHPGGGARRVGPPRRGLALPRNPFLVAWEQPGTRPVGTSRIRCRPGSPSTGPGVAIHPLRPEQQAAVARLARPGLIVMPTGTGKTEVALTAMAEVSLSTLVVAPVRDLMYQWHRRILASLGYDAGIVGDNLFRVRPVSVTTYDSACIHMERLGNQFGLMVFDECHHLPGEVRRDAARMSAAPMRLGLTATPVGGDSSRQLYGARIEICAPGVACLRRTHSHGLSPYDPRGLIGPIVYEMPIAAAKGGRWPITRWCGFPSTFRPRSRSVTTSSRGRCGPT